MNETTGNHCWHGDISLMSYPPVIREKCCHCGTIRDKRQTLETGHGPHCPPSYKDAAWSYIPGVDPKRCPKAPTEARK